MQNLFKRIKNLWSMSELEGFSAYSDEPGLKPLTEAEAQGEFLSDMSESEVLDYERKERMGWKNFKLPWQK